MTVGLFVATTVLVVLAVVGIAGYLIVGSVPEDDDEASAAPNSVTLR